MTRLTVSLAPGTTSTGLSRAPCASAEWRLRRTARVGWSWMSIRWRLATTARQVASCSRLDTPTRVSGTDRCTFTSSFHETAPRYALRMVCSTLPGQLLCDAA
jgi:hypothetical protein